MNVEIKEDIQPQRETLNEEDSNHSPALDVLLDNTLNPVKDSSWQDDIERRKYYYDDSSGYETYDPDKDDADEED